MHYNLYRMNGDDDGGGVYREWELRIQKLEDDTIIDNRAL